MSKTKIGDAMAYCGRTEEGRSVYIRIGAAFEEVVDGVSRISVKIDSIPIPSAGWQGWVNIWTDETGRSAGVAKAAKARREPLPGGLGDDDVPF